MDEEGILVIDSLPVVIAPLSNATSSSDLASYSFAMTLSATGHNIAIFAGQGGSSVASSATIDGATATKVAEVTATSRNLSIWIAPATGNASGNAVINYGGTQNRAGCATYGMTNAGSATATFTGTDVGGNPLVVLTNCNAGGGVIAATYSDGNVTFTFTNVTKYADQSIEGGNVCMSSGYANFASAQTSLSVEAALNTVPGNELMVVAAWGP